MYGIFTNIYPINEPNVGKYTIHGASGYIYIYVYIYTYIYITHNDDVKQEIWAVLSSGKIISSQAVFFTGGWRCCETRVLEWDIYREYPLVN